MKILFGTDKVMRGYTTDEDFLLSLQSSNAPLTPAEDGLYTVDDRTYLAQQPSSTMLKSDVIAVHSPDVSHTFTYESLTPNVCIVNAAGNVTGLITGSCSIEVSSHTGTRRIDQVIGITAGTTIYSSQIARADTSLRKYLYDQQIAALVDVVPGAVAQRGHAKGNNALSGGWVTAFGPEKFGAVNTNNFLFAQNKPGFDGFPTDILACVLAGPEGLCEWMVWISDHHYLTWNGHNSNQGAGYVNIAELVVVYSATAWTGSLARLMPVNFRNWLPRNDVAETSLGSDICVWSRLYHTYDGVSGLTSERRWVQPNNCPYHAFLEGDVRRAYQKIDPSTGRVGSVGDSGSPSFFGIHGDLVLYGFDLYNSVDYATPFNYTSKVPQINAAMNDLATAAGDANAGNYAVLHPELSMFATYP